MWEAMWEGGGGGYRRGGLAGRSPRRPFRACLEEGEEEGMMNTHEPMLGPERTHHTSGENYME